MTLSRVEHARQRVSAQDVTGARRECAAILADTKADARELAGAHLVLATCCQRVSDNESAVAHARSAVGLTPDDPLARYALAELMEASDKQAAIANLRRAVELDSQFVQAWNYLGILLGESGDDRGAAAAFETTVQLDQQHARAWNNLGNAQRSLGQLTQAMHSFARALALRPDYQLAAANLAAAQRDLGEVEIAEVTAREALARMAGKPRFRPLVVILAGLLRDRGAFDESAQLYLEAIKAAPDQSAGEWISMARVMSECGQPERAREAFHRARALDGKDLRAALGAELTLPMIYEDNDALAAARARYRLGLDNLQRDFEKLIGGLSETQALDGFRATNFFLAYQGQDDRLLQETYGSFVARAIDTIAPHWRTAIAPRVKVDSRIRVGFASAFFHVGTVGRYFVSWITDLDPALFEVIVYHLFPGIDDVAAAIQARADRFRAYVGSRARPSIVAPDIRADALDVLIYPELGMDATSFGLAALRLAPLQYAGWGHPVTTGIDTIDAFLSCATMEPDDAQTHYSERLITLPGIGTRYRRPDAPADGDRRQFGLDENATLFLCPQSLFKIHPDNDELFARMLAQSPGVLLVLFAGRHPAITDQFMRRLSRACERHGIAIRERVRVLPPFPHEDFLRINRACDAMVDTLHWSGGNTSLDALACELPIVTLPGAFMRGRQSAGMLSLLGVTELIARDQEDYLAIARRLAAEPHWRQALRSRIAAAQNRLFDLREPTQKLQEILREAVRG